MPACSLDSSPPRVCVCVCVCVCMYVCMCICSYIIKQVPPVSLLKNVLYLLGVELRPTLAGQALCHLSHSASPICVAFLKFWFPWQYWGMNSGPPDCYPCTLPLEPHHNPTLIILKKVFTLCLCRLELQSSYLCCPHIAGDSRHMPSHPGIDWKRFL
jgi:hypothetical protein